MSNDFLFKTIRFGINGFIVVLGAYLLIRIFLALGMGYLISSIISYIIMVFISYLSSTSFVFKSKKTFSSLFHFLISQGLAFLLFNIANYLLYKSGLDKNYCFFIAIIFSTTTNFIYNNFVTFKK